MYRSYSELRSDVEAGKTSLTEIVKGYLQKIEEGKHLNAFLSVFSEKAISDAKKIEAKIKNKTAGKLAGMVIAVKDVLSIKGKKLTCGSKILESFESLYTATAVQRLIDEDAIIIGKTNCDEFAMGSSNENSAFGIVRNPVDESRVPGGSSGGSAAAVSAGMCLASLGTDTGGSVRQPASFCGIFGMKPTYGRVSRYGLTAFASSFDTVGVFANNIEDTAFVLEVISGYDKMDSTSVKQDVPEFSSQLKSAKKPVVGFLNVEEKDDLQKEISSAYKKTREELSSKGFTLKQVEIKHLKYSIQTYYILTTAEASSNLARYDGAKYGIRSKDSSTMEEMFVNSRTEGFGTEVKRRIMLGTYVLSSGYYDAYYKKAQQVRRLIKEDFQKAFDEVDLLILPTTPTTAFKLGEKIDDPLAMYLNDIYTTAANLSGNPAISIPLGKDKNNLPFGLQIIGKDFDEVSVLRFGKFLQA